MSDVAAWLCFALVTIAAFAAVFVVMLARQDTSVFQYQSLEEAWYIVVVMIFAPELPEEDFRDRPWVYLIFCLYCFMMSVLLLNLLIAMMSSSYERITLNSQVEFRFAFVGLVKEFRARALMPPPLLLLWLPLELYQWTAVRLDTARGASTPSPSKADAALSARNSGATDRGGRATWRRRIRQAERNAQAAYLKGKQEETARSTVHTQLRELTREVAALQSDMTWMRKRYIQRSNNARWTEVEAKKMGEEIT
ncbi:hypothetical protein CYMTET_20124 [Cymbomonas tetramitiformis]|uniref:Ion transport domain-containing protein n=1 Tax=Cymbomonas tetramitiformis TaxID=36881 RepID=A0AAE0L495_9CHLO|nr:hypothetical protein CYMTET_20124 [Cymbomonas tetramitiformis]